MPLIDVTLIEGVFSPDQQQEIVRRLTDALVDTSGDRGIAGMPLHTAGIKARAAGAATG
jgi:4-oxalocrotonate tautomerase